MTAHCVRNELQTAHFPWCSEFFTSPASLQFLSIHFKSRSIQDYMGHCARFFSSKFIDSKLELHDEKGL